MSTSVSLRPSDAFRAGAQLRTSEARARAAQAFHAILKERGYGAVEELRRALDVSTTTIRNWRPGGEWHPNPEQVRQIATAYAARTDEPVTSLVDLELTAVQEAAVDDLFDLFYSDNHRAACDWLLEHKRSYFRCNMMDEAPKVA